MCAVIRSSEPAGPSEPGSSHDPVTSRRNPLVARLRALHQPGGRREQQRLLLEGTHLLEEALEQGLLPELLLATPRWIERHRGLLGTHPQAASALRRVSDAVLEAVATTSHPDGVVASLPWPEGPPPGRVDFVLALDRLQDPGNLGTLMRTALAAGVGELWLAEGADPFQPKVLRASAGAALALPMRRLTPLEPELERARQEGAQLVATVVRGGQPYWQVDWSRPTVLVLGNEGAGVADGIRAICTHQVRIPHSPAVESLNVAVAAGPLLLERWRQRTDPGGNPRRSP